MIRLATLRSLRPTSLLRCRRTTSAGSSVLSASPSHSTVPSSTDINTISDLTVLADLAAVSSGSRSSSVQETLDSKPAHHQLVRAIQHIPKKVKELEEKAAIDGETYRGDAVTAAARGGLFLRQLRIEEEQQEEAVNTYTDSLKQLISIGKGTGLKHVQRVLLRWYEPLTQEIAAEMKLVARKVPGKYRAVYGPCMLLLPPEKLAVITLDAAINSVLQTGNNGAQVTSLAKRIGELIEAEVNIIKLKKGKSGLRPWQQDLLKEAYNSTNFRMVSIRLNRLVSEEKWAEDVKVKLGAALVSFLLQTAKTEANTPAFIHLKITKSKPKPIRRIGLIRLEATQYRDIALREMQKVLPRYLPMLVPPRGWDNRKPNKGCYFRLKSTLIRSTSRQQLEATRRAHIGTILESLDYLGSMPWRINRRMQKIIKEAWDRQLPLGELPSTNIPMPKEEDCFRIPKPPKKKPAAATVAVAALTAEEEAALTTEERAALAAKAEELKKEEAEKESLLVKEASAEPEPEPELSLVPIFDEKYYQEMRRRVTIKNAELHSLRCDLLLKFWVAEKFQEERFYYPYNLDFRGRAYPVPPNLNHLGSDLCRAMLLFDDAKPLGKNGLMWMKVHLANLFGHNKVRQSERVEWVENQMDKVYDCARNPLDGSRWWTEADEPFQALATCLELVDAIESGDPENFQSRLAIHQDGSCNGLQHYAALGRDEAGAYAVNVKPSDRPQDVYTAVLHIVQRKINEDVNADETVEKDEEARLRGKYARMVQSVVNRKVIKQTVMTSVYGVTKVGARAQVQARLEEKFMTDPSAVMTPELEKELFGAARYVANLTLESLQEMFSGAKEIMDWLGTCASLVAAQGQVMSWMTPLGLPVMQPYRKMSLHSVSTILQTISLAVDNDALPVAKQKQRSAFPPNFVHSLDATHMLLTTMKMKQQGIVFAAVHDSYWTHAADVPAMNKAIRECFVDLYEQPILEDLRDSLVLRYPDIDFPPVPERGTLDIKAVKDSVYFFH